MSQDGSPVGIPYRLVRSQRKTLAIVVRPGQEVLVRAPFFVSQKEIDRFVDSRADWVKKHYQAKKERIPEYTKAQEKALREQAAQTLPGLVARFAAILKVHPQKISVNGARTRFGSCSVKGNLNFSFRLMAYPTPCVEYVALHEVAHLLHMNHSPAFYQTIFAVMPDYKERAKRLKQNP